MSLAFHAFIGFCSLCWLSVLVAGFVEAAPNGLGEGFKTAMIISGLPVIIGGVLAIMTGGPS